MLIDASRQDRETTRLNRRLLIRLLLDAAMTALILLEFAYQLVGNTVHELIGILTLVMFVVHAKWNWQWFLSLFRGRYTGFRRASVTINVLLLVAAVMMMVSGLLHSNILHSFFGVEFELLSREFHTTAAYWFLVLLAVHLGMHWVMVMAEARNLAGSVPSRFRTVVLQSIAAIIAAYGIHAIVERRILYKLAAYFSFDYWNFDDSILGFFAQYASVIGLFAYLTHNALRFFKSRTRLNRASHLSATPSPAVGANERRRFRS
jgi:hypothetical protein